MYQDKPYPFGVRVVSVSKEGVTVTTTEPHTIHLRICARFTLTAEEAEDLAAQLIQSSKEARLMQEDDPK